MKYIKESEDFKKGKRIIGYHITQKKYLEKILKEGLEPRVPTDFGPDGDVKGIYLFKTVDDMDNALMNWFGERLEEWEEEHGEEFEDLLLVVDLTGLDLYDSVEFEWTCLEHIAPDRILEYHLEATTDTSEELNRKYEN